MKKYSVAYFIKKFEKIPHENWAKGILEISTAKCALGHCGTKLCITGDYKINKESYELIKLFGGKNKNDTERVYEINDDREHNIHLGNTPKDRIINYLKGLKK